ncbi:MAG: hypothetical protein NXI30_05890 [bacterium]|nr:hypothetical protein [bacterium]
MSQLPELADSLRKLAESGTDYRLSRMFLNLIYERAVELGLDPADFEMETYVLHGGGGTEMPTFRHRCTRMRHGPTEGYFSFGRGIDEEGCWTYPCEWSPSHRERTNFGSPPDRETQVHFATEDWLTAIKVEKESPNLWEGVQLAIEASAGSEGPNELLGVDARIAFAKDLDAIQSDFEERFAESQSAIDDLRKEIDFLKGSTQRLGWIDLKRSAVASAVTLGMQHGPAFASELLQRILAAIERVPELPAGIVL